MAQSLRQFPPVQPPGGLRPAARSGLVGAGIAAAAYALGAMLGSLAFAALLFVFLDFQFDIAAWPLSTLLIAASCLTLAVLFRSRLDYCSHISGRFF